MQLSKRSPASDRPSPGRPRTKGRGNRPSARRSAEGTAEVGDRTVEDLAIIAEQLADVYSQIVANDISRKRRAWTELTMQITGHICGLAALSILATVAWHAFDRGAPTQGASIICTGAASIVAAFVTGRSASRNKK